MFRYLFEEVFSLVALRVSAVFRPLSAYIFSFNEALLLYVTIRV